MSGLPIVQPRVLDAIQAHVNSAWARKVGGLLLGRPGERGLVIDTALPASLAETYEGEIAFPSEVWHQAYAALDHQPRGARIVGWYHSHPGTGVTLSEYDRRLQRTLFGDPWTVALVVDPIAEALAWYGWDIRDLSEGQPPRRPAPAGTVNGRGQPGRGARAAAAGLVVLGLVAGGAGGYWLSDWHDHADQGSTAALTRQVQAQHLELDRIRRLLHQAREITTHEETRLRELRSDLDAAKRSLREARRKLRQAGPFGVVVHHPVQPGDSLWDLAGTFYGDPQKWPKILDANRSVISDPDRLEVGQVLAIPLGP
jgi:proteasome lid subunit RPN8/RPN11